MRKNRSRWFGHVMRKDETMSAVNVCLFDVMGIKSNIMYNNWLVSMA